MALIVQADMLAYRAKDEPLQLGLPETLVCIHSDRDNLANSSSRIGTPEATQLVANVSRLYSPELTVGYSAVSGSEAYIF